MLALCRHAPFRQPRSANRQLTCLLCPPVPRPPRSDPTHFPFILAYMRDRRVPPLPSGLLDLQQLQVEAEFFVIEDLAAAAGAAAAAIEARNQAAQQVEEVRAALILAAQQAVAQAQQEYDRIILALASLRAAVAEEKAVLGKLDELNEQAYCAVTADDSDNEAVFHDPEEQRQLVQQLEAAKSRAKELNAQLQAEKEQEAPAAARLRDALLARLLALGADLPAAKAQLRATNPQLEREARKGP